MAASVGSIDTESIISQLMAVERNPQDLLKAQVTTLQRQQTAWQSIADKLTALKTASDAVTGLDAMSNLRTVSSSNTSAITVRSIGAGASSSSSIDVVALAAAKSVLGSDLFGSATDAVGGRTLDITKTGGSPVRITSTDGTIGGLAAAVNAANLGVSAKVLQTAPGQYQLSLTATSSGTAASFTATGTGWTSLDTVRDAADAQIRVDGVLMTRSSNVISDVLDGTELTLLGTTTGPVTVSSARDDAAITTNVKALVDAANALNSIINTVTKTSTTASERGALAGDFGARQLMDSIRDAIAQPLKTAAGKITTSSALGISLNRDGTINFDPTALTASLASDPDTVLAVIGRNAFSTANGVSVIGATSVATTSSRAITVTQAASQALLVGMVTPPPAPGTQVSMNIVTPSGSVSVAFVAGSTNAETAANLNAALRAAGVKMTAVAQPSGSIDLREDRFGSNNGFSVTGGAAIGLNGAATDGTDATGTIDGVAFTATGKSLTSGGVVMSIATTATQLAAAGGTVTGTVSLTTGLAGVLSTIGARGGENGSVLASNTTLQDQIDDLNQRITRYDDTLKQHEDMLRTKFTAMQTMIDKLNSMQTPLNNLAASG
ncbi:MAG: flagellar filament capping protein FliD [Ilumatobacteraceae bacterium]